MAEYAFAGCVFVVLGAGAAVPPVDAEVEVEGDVEPAAAAAVAVVATRAPTMLRTPASRAGVPASSHTLHGQTPGAGAGCAVLKVHVYGAAMALPAVSVAEADTV